MRNIYSILFVCVFSFSGLNAQKFALVDVEYIMSKIPAYTTMTRQLEEQSKKWQAEVTKLEQEAEALYKKFQAEVASLTMEQRHRSEEAVISKERLAYELKRKYFGPDGELVKRRESMMKPLQEELWRSLKSLATGSGLQLVLDKSTGKIVYADPNLDVSMQILQKMGYGN